nr:MAG TPA: hypothetical protein [Caudoviricetes sp.]
MAIREKPLMVISIVRVFHPRVLRSEEPKMRASGMKPGFG